LQKIPVLQKNSLLIAILWFLFISILFCLPGSALPKASWLDKIYFDKWVHVGLFFVLLWLWLWALKIKGVTNALILLCFFAIAYGITVEFVQDRFVPNRSFDLGDWAADIAGVVLGSFLRLKYIQKNRPL
jgi:VanZ family protein